MKKYSMIKIICGIIIGALIKNAESTVFAEDVSESLPKVPEIYIKAINPGYTIEGVNNVGEMIEIGRLNSDTMISLAGLTVGYTNSSGNYAVLAEFPENSYLAGESVLLRLASSPNSELANGTYAKTLAFKAGPLVLMRGDEVVDSVCWTGKDDCDMPFKSAEPTTLVRNIESGFFEHITEYEPKYDEKNFFVEKILDDDDKKEDEDEEKAESRCRGLIFSEILSYYEESRNEQFIELYNSASEQILLDDCKIKYKNKFYRLKGIIKPEEYYAWFLTDFSLTKNPTNFNDIELIDIDDTQVDKLSYPNGQRKGTSYALLGYDEKGDEIWRTTYAMTPGEPNNYQEFRTCETGKVINEVTGNCVKVTSVIEKTCPAGQVLNPLTGRCKKIEVTAEKTCKEGYELNEATGRCRKIQENNGANYSLVTEKYEEKTSFIALYAVVGVVILGVVYVIYEFRAEMRRLFRKVFRRSR